MGSPRKAKGNDPAPRRYLNVHCLHDDDSLALAGMIAAAIGARVIREPTDTKEWSGIRIFDEEAGTWVASLRWLRGTPRDLDQAAHQLTKAAAIEIRDGLRSLPEPALLADELGVELNWKRMAAARRRAR